jgi:hypothetical protein
VLIEKLAVKTRHSSHGREQTRAANVQAINLPKRAYHKSWPNFNKKIWPRRGAPTGQKLGLDVRFTGVPRETARRRMLSTWIELKNRNMLRCRVAPHLTFDGVLLIEMSKNAVARQDNDIGPCNDLCRQSSHWSVISASGFVTQVVRQCYSSRWPRMQRRLTADGSSRRLAVEANR